MIRFIVAAVLCLIPSIALASSWETSSFRTANGQLVRLGMTKAEVRRDAGAPLEKGKLAHPKRKVSSTGKRGGEVWIYKGSDGVYTISFIKDRVAKIDVSPFRGR